MAAAASAIVAILACSAVAGAKRRCYINTRPRYPTVTSPCPRAHVVSGAHVTFTVRDLNPSAHTYMPFLILGQAGAQARGRARSTPRATASMTSSSRSGAAMDSSRTRPREHRFAGYWNVTPGRYYLQIHQLESGCTTPQCTVYSPVSTIIVDRRPGSARAAGGRAPDLGSERKPCHGAILTFT